MIWRVLRVEIRRGVAPVAAVLTAAAGLATFRTEEFGPWWMDMAEVVLLSLVPLLPIVMAVAAWQGGDERRRNLTDLVSTTPRPRGHDIAATWAATTAGCLAGLLVVVAVGVAHVGPRASYHGGGWPWLLVAAAAAVGAVAALGLVIGRILPYRVLVPAVAIGTYAVAVIVLDSDQRQWLARLTPVPYATDFHAMAVNVPWAGLMVAWLCALVVAVLVAASARRRLVRVLVWVVPAILAWLVGGEEPVRVDHAAVAAVCTESGPTVCVARMNAAELDDAADAAAPVMAAWAGVDGALTRAEDLQLWWHGGRTHDDTMMWLEFDQDRWRTSFTVPLGCPIDTFDRAADTRLVADVANAWGDRWDPSPPYVLEEEAAAALDVLEARPQAAQDEWATRYVAAARACDEGTLVALGEELAS